MFKVKITDIQDMSSSQEYIYVQQTNDHSHMVIGKDMKPFYYDSRSWDIKFLDYLSPDELKIYFGKSISNPNDASIQTFTGRVVRPFNLKPNDVSLEDIAHALSMKTRYTGHGIKFYSVAEHSILMSRWIDEDEDGCVEGALYALLHDATETYLPDVASPMKKHFPGFKELENNISDAIFTYFEMDPCVPKIIKEVDTSILLTEMQQNMRFPPNLVGVEKLDVKLQFWSPEKAEKEFIRQYGLLTSRL